MKKLPNIHPGEVLLEEFLLPMAISQYKPAKDLNIPQTRVSNIIKGKRRITAEYAGAISFLTDKTKGKRVFLKFDKVKYDDENNLLGYLYLENKTFINAHLIKNGLVQVDSGIDFKCRDKFLNLSKRENSSKATTV